MRLSFASIMIGLAATWLVLAYVVQPFRRKKPPTDRMIEAWIADIRSELPPKTSGGAVPLDGSLHYCPKCGRRVEDDHQFCPGCGTRLSEDLPE